MTTVADLKNGIVDASKVMEILASMSKDLGVPIITGRQLPTINAYPSVQYVPPQDQSVAMSASTMNRLADEAEMAIRRTYGDVTGTFVDTTNTYPPTAHKVTYASAASSGPIYIDNSNDLIANSTYQFCESGWQATPGSWQATTSYETVRVDQNNKIIIGGQGDIMVSIDATDGSVEYGEGADINKATDIFWQALALSSPAVLKKENERLQNQIDQLANFILNNYDDRIRGGGAVETAIEILSESLPQEAQETSSIRGYNGITSPISWGKHIADEVDNEVLQMIIEDAKEVKQDYDAYDRAMKVLK